LTTVPSRNSIAPVGKLFAVTHRRGKKPRPPHLKFVSGWGNTLIKQDIVHHVIERTGLPRAKAEAAVDTVFEGLKQALSAGDRIELRGFGVFSVRPRKTGIGRNPRTGTEVNIAPGKAVRFKPGKDLHALDTGAS